MTTDKQAEANRRNAQLSTGPKTPEGKAASARNAQKHGVYASTLWAISHGPLQEIPDELQAAYRELRDSLNPRDRVEEEQASLIALSYLRFRRIETMESCLLNGEGIKAWAEGSVPAHLDPLIQLETLREISEFLEGYDPVTFAGHANFEKYSHVANDWFALGEATIPGLWDKTATPSNEAEWRRAFDAMLKSFWKGSTTSAASYFREERENLWRQISPVMLARDAKIAGDMLDLLSNKSARLRSRAGRELERNHKLLYILQQRDLPAEEADDE